MTKLVTLLSGMAYLFEKDLSAIGIQLQRAPSGLSASDELGLLSPLMGISHSLSKRGGGNDAGIVYVFQNKVTIGLKFNRSITIG